MEIGSTGWYVLCTEYEVEQFWVTEEKVYGVPREIELGTVDVTHRKKFGRLEEKSRRPLWPHLEDLVTSFITASQLRAALHG